MSLVLFVVGLVALIKGNFRMLNRAVSKRDGRLIGLVLMGPFLLEVVIVFSLSFSMVAQNMVVGDDGSVSVSAQMFEDYLAQVMGYEPLLLIAAAVAIGVAAAIVLRSPQASGTTAWPMPATPEQPKQTQQPQRAHPLSTPVRLPTASARPVAAPPSIMTVAEAAAYLHVTPAEVDQMIDQGRLPAARSPGGFRIARSALDEIVRGEL